MRLEYLLRVVALSLLSVPNAAEDRANLEDYMRFTPAPGPGNETDAFFPTMEPSLAPTLAPTTTKPTFAPSEEPTTEEPTTEAPTDSPTQLPTASPSLAPSTLTPTEAPTAEPVTNSPTDSPTDSPTAPPTHTPTDSPKKAELPETEEPQETSPPSPAPTDKIVVVAPQADAVTDETWDLFSETMEHHDSIGEVFVDFSLYSPNVTNLQINFMKLKMGVCGSLDVLVCDQAHPIREQGPEFCAVRDDVLLRDGASQSRQDPFEFTDFDVTVMALATTKVKDETGVIQDSTSISWTTWRMSYSVMQLGPALRQHINVTDGPDMDESDITKKGLAMLQQMMTVNMERTLRDGVFENDINLFMKDIMILSSVVGEETLTYETAMGDHPVSSAHQGQELAGEDEEGGGLMVIFFFAGLGVACFVIVALLYFSFRSRRSVTRRKRTIVIVDDTSKETDSQGSSSDNRVVVVDAQDALEKDAPRAQQEPPPQWEAASSVGANSSAGPGEGDVESQWGRSMAQSSAYTGSISAITGVSGLEHSDTWSVGSMSIDLAEWG